MAIRFGEEFLNTENPFIDLLMYSLKIIAFNCVIKNEHEANENETEESIKSSELYIDCLEGNAKAALFDRIPDEFLRKVGISEPQIKLYNSSGFDQYYIPKI